MTYDRWDRRKYAERLGDATSLWFNVAVFNGMPDESVSGRAFRNTTQRERDGLRVARRWRFLRAASDTLFFWEPDHAKVAYLTDLARARARVAHIAEVDRARIQAIYDGSPP